MYNNIHKIDRVNRLLNILLWSGIIVLVVGLFVSTAMIIAGSALIAIAFVHACLLVRAERQQRGPLYMWVWMDYPGPEALMVLRRTPIEEAEARQRKRIEENEEIARSIFRIRSALPGSSEPNSGGTTATLEQPPVIEIGTK